jgi:hypothetical protein
MDDQDELRREELRVSGLRDQEVEPRNPPLPGSPVFSEAGSDQGGDSGVEEEKVNTYFPSQKGFQNEFIHKYLTYHRKGMNHQTRSRITRLIDEKFLKEGHLDQKYSLKTNFVGVKHAVHLLRKRCSLHLAVKLIIYTNMENNLCESS